MVTLSNENVFSVTSPLWGDPTGPGGFPSQRPVTPNFDVFFDPRWTKDWANNRDVGNLGRDRAHYDVAVKSLQTVSPN